MSTQTREAAAGSRTTIAAGPWAGQEYLSSEEISARMRALAPLLEVEAPKIRKEGCLTKELKDAFRDAGLFRIGWPAAWGGPQMRLEEQIGLVEFVAQYDAGAAWSVMILVDGGFYATRLGDPDVAHEIYPTMDLATSATAYPPGRAAPVEGGYRLTGRWAFGSGIRNADRSVCGFHKFDANGNPELDETGAPQMYDVWVHRENIVVHDTWYTTGLEGSGSADFSLVGDVVVPESHMMARSFAPEPDLEPYGRAPWLMEATQIGVSLGLAKHAIAVYEGFVGRPGNKSSVAIKTNPAVMAVLAEASALYDAARCLTMSAYSDVTDSLLAGQQPTQVQCGKMLGSLVASAQLCRDAIELIMDSAGSRGVLVTNDFDQIFRDMSTAIRHPLHRRSMYERAGQHYLNALEGNEDGVA